MVAEFSGLDLSPFTEFSEQLCEAGTVSPHYVRVLYLRLGLKRMLLWPFTDVCRAQGNARGLMCTFPAKVQRGSALPSCFSHGRGVLSLWSNERPLSGAFLSFPLVIFMV